MKILKKIKFSLIIILGLNTVIINNVTAQSQQADGISFYEHNDDNGNGKVDDGETSKLARLVFEEGENIAIDSKFKEGSGNLYVVSEKGEIIKTIPQQYETGIKSSKLLENLPTGKYTTVFQKDGSNDLAGSYIKVVGKGGDLNQGIEKDVFQERGIDLGLRKNYLLLADKWNDFTKDGAPQNWEVSRPQSFEKPTFKEGDSPVILSKSGSIVMTWGSLKKTNDKSFSEFSYKEKRTRKKPMAIQLPTLTKGDYKLMHGGSFRSKIKVLSK